MTVAAIRCPHCNGELELIALGRAVPANDATESFDAWAERWFAHRRALGVDRERRRYAQWIRPSLGTLCAVTISRADVQTLVERLDEAVDSGRIRWSTARRIWILARVMLADLSRSKTRALRVRDDSPVAGVRGPDRGEARSATFLYPSEFLQLVTCPAVHVSVRSTYALAVYLYPRAGELRALEWGDINSETGRIHIHRTADRETGELRPTKTGCIRQFVAEPAVLPLLRAMHASAASARITGDCDGGDLSRRLRAHLRAAGCIREALHASDITRRPVTFHDLRATGITWQAMRGDSISDIMERVGHVQMMTTQGYMRRGRLLATLSGEQVFPPLPEDLLCAKK